MSKTQKKVHWPSVFDAILIYAGAIVIVLLVAWMAADPYQRAPSIKRLEIALVGVGLVLNQIGVWHIASHFTSGRRFFALRQEVDDFIKLVRQMNTHVLAGDQERLGQVKSRMHDSVERMVELAGKEGKG